MADTKSGLLGTDDASSAQNPNGIRRQAAPAQQNPYQGGLQTNFNNQYSTSNYDQTEGNKYNTSTSNDADVRGAQAAYNQMTHGDAGTSNAEQTSLYNMYEGRIGQKNSLAEQIAGAPGLLNQEQDINKSVSGHAVGTGLKNTRQNFNSRGLLYSGAREGGEQAVKTQGASDLAQSMAVTARDSANRTTAAQDAYAAVDLASAKDQLDRVTNAFDTANANNIARTQAMQQLMGGVGSAAGTIYGSYNSTAGTNPTTGWQPEKLQNPGIGSQYDSQSSYGLLNRAG